MHKNWYKKRQHKYNIVEFSSKVVPVLSLYQSTCNVRIVTIVYVLGRWWRWALLSLDGAGWSVCLPLLIFPCTIKSRSSTLAPAHPGGPGKRAVKRLWW